ncbi:hypothetical protein BOTBODRAFT_108193 [Botryobasidium botryosum FD-172 SS1]|uniref:VASt domain-containing protein n=1 Tax=Botryobasidium botryosum (strain FD-172 SS1) TaxID=930990 RepID=A0A067MIT7_BOTB1|nr:hypothetical protein BOTBODRAFT_108193 [Botryobasidium botryosum FD-172 SS1]
MTAFVIPNAIHVQCKGDVKYTFASFLARDTVFDVIYNIWRLSHPTSPLLGATLPAAAAKRKESAGSEVTPLSLDPSASKGVTPGAGASTTRRPPTTCKCPQHFSEVVMDCVLPGSPESIYNLMFASGFIKNFLTSEQKLIDLQISDWVPEKPDSPLLKRNMSYIKPLNGSIGPKQTKCELTDETLHMDFNDYVCTMTTTRTPDVPSGGVFSVKTRTCITWAGGMHAKVFITTTVEWTGRSFIKSIIERSVLDGQRTYHQDLEKAMRAYIAEHRTEFVPEGEDDLAALAADEIIGADAVPSTPHAPRSPEEEQLERLKDTELRGLQWALDTITGASKVARESFWGAVDVLGDLAESAPAGNMWLWLVLFLLVSNIWTLASLRQANKREDMTRRRAGIGNGYGSVGAGGVEEREREITAQAVRAFLEGITKQQGWAPTGASLEEGSTLINAREEVARLQRSLDAIEVQVGRLRERLHSPASVEGEASGEGSHTEL